MKFFGAMLLIIGILLTLALGIIKEESTGINVSSGYMQNGTYKEFDNYVPGEDLDGLNGAQILKTTGVTSLIIGGIVLFIGLVKGSNKTDY